MAALIKTKPIPTLHNIHVADEATIIDFLNANSKQIGGLKNLGTFIDNIKIKNDIGIKANLQFLIVERIEFQGEKAGENYIYNADFGTDIFEYEFTMPDIFPTTTSETKEYIIPSTIKTHSCTPKVKCSKCKASGLCQSCDARGYNNCFSCQGSGKRKVSDGKFANGKIKYIYIACSSCQGSGRKTCGSCNGTAKCYKCKGSGEVICSKCKGTSFYQSYKGFSNTYKTVITTFNFSEYEDLKNIIPITKNKIVFDDILIEWKKNNEIVITRVYDVIKRNKHSVEFIESFENLAGLTLNQRFGRIYATIETIPISIVDYSFEENKFQLKIIGENNIVCYKKIPKKHNYKPTIFKRFINFITTKKKRQIAFAYIASYILNSDSSMKESALKLFDLFISNIKLKPEEKNNLIVDLKQQITIEELKLKIKSIRGDKRALIFAWQCVMQDEQINQNEIVAFNELSKLFKIEGKELEKIKHKAIKIAHLTDSEMLEEYFI